MDLTKFLTVFDFVIKAILPGTLKLAGVPDDKNAEIIDLTSQAETALGPGTGPAKLQAVLKGVGDGMALKGAKPETIAAVTSATSTGINAAFEIAKQVHALHTSTTDAAGSVPTPAPGGTV